jgi:hypothetical protein
VAAAVAAVGNLVSTGGACNLAALSNRSGINPTQ